MLSIIRIKMEEKQYRELVSLAFKTIENAFDAVDPDLAECVFSQGALTVTFSDRTKLILSQQPSVRQIWVAAASKGIAYHFNYDTKNQQWFDDKGTGVELFQFVKKIVLESGKVGLAI